MLVIKVGGEKTLNWEAIAQDIAYLSEREKIVLIHGANAERNELAQKLDVEVKTIISPSGISSVLTDSRMIEVILMTYCGLVNKKLVALLQKHKINAIGLSGLDGGLWRAQRKAILKVQQRDKIKIIRDNFTGRVEEINTNLIKLLLKNNFLPVVSTPALSFENEIVNVDNDWATAVMAVKLKAKTIIFLFDKPGLLKDPTDENSLIHKIERDKLEQAFQVSQGRMKKKILGVQRAFEGGVKEIIFGDGRVEKPIRKALEGNGTIFR